MVKEADGDQKLIKSGGVRWVTISIRLIVSVGGIAGTRIIKHYTSKIKTGGKRA